MMLNIPDAPWIAQTRRTGHFDGGYWNSTPRVEDSIICDRCRESIWLGEDYYDIDGENLCEECFDIVTRGWRRTHGE